MYDQALPALGLPLADLVPPILVLSTRVGRGMFSLGEALVERLDSKDVRHRAIEEFLPQAALQEDVRRYRTISSRFPFLLHIVYRFPPIYWRKLKRERHVARTDLSPLAAMLAAEGIRTVLCVSHRPAFWAAGLKEELGLEVEIIGYSGEYGSSLGWKYIAWDSMAGFLSPVPRSAIRFELPEHVAFADIELPARREYEEVAHSPGDPGQVLVVCGLWGQGRIDRVVQSLLDLDRDLQVHAVCGDNTELRDRVTKRFAHRKDVSVHGLVDSLAPLLKRCGSVVTKPGIATLVEARAAGRKIFLLRGMPVAEDNNARHAVSHFDAEWFGRGAFVDWLDRQGDLVP